MVMVFIYLKIFSGFLFVIQDYCLLGLPKTIVVPIIKMAKAVNSSMYSRKLNDVLFNSCMLSAEKTLNIRKIPTPIRI